MTQHGLKRAQIGPAFEQMGRKRMAQHMRADPRGIDACFGSECTHKLEEAHAAQIGFARREQPWAVIRHMGAPTGHCRASPIRNRNQALSPAFSSKNEEGTVARQSAGGQRNQFGSPQTGTV